MFSFSVFLVSFFLGPNDGCAKSTPSKVDGSPGRQNPVERGKELGAIRALWSEAPITGKRQNQFGKTSKTSKTSWASPSGALKMCFLEDKRKGVLSCKVGKMGWRKYMSLFEGTSFLKKPKHLPKKKNLQLLQPSSALLASHPSSSGGGSDREGHGDHQSEISDPGGKGGRSWPVVYVKRANGQGGKKNQQKVQHQDHKKPENH